jgi:putative hydrolase of the HAD superfamily
MNEQLIHIIRGGARPLEVIPTHVEPLPLDPGGPAVKALLFDVYGTLFISASGDIGSTPRKLRQDPRILALLEEYGVEKNAARLETQFIQTVKAAHHRARRRGVDFPEVRYEDIWATVLGWKDSNRLKTFAAAYEMIVNPVYPMPHLKQVLMELKNRRIKMGIISNAQFFTPLLFPAFLDLSLEELGFDPQLSIYSYECGVAKPSLHMFLKARDILAAGGIEPENVLYMGNDMLNDIYPAGQARFRTLLFAGDRRSLRLREDDERCRNLQPGGIVTQLPQLISLPFR